MKFTSEELAHILGDVQFMQNDEFGIDKIFLMRKSICEKISKELDKRGYPTIVSKSYLKRMKK